MLLIKGKDLSSKVPLLDIFRTYSKFPNKIKKRRKENMKHLFGTPFPSLFLFIYFNAQKEKEKNNNKKQIYKKLNFHEVWPVICMGYSSKSLFCITILKYTQPNFVVIALNTKSALDNITAQALTTIARMHINHIPTRWKPYDTNSPQLCLSLGQSGVHHKDTNKD